MVGGLSEGTGIGVGPRRLRSTGSFCYAGRIPVRREGQHATRKKSSYNYGRAGAADAAAERRGDALKRIEDIVFWALYDDSTGKLLSYHDTKPEALRAGAEELDKDLSRRLVALELKAGSASVEIPGGVYPGSADEGPGMPAYEERTPTMAREDDWCFEADDCNIVIETSMGRQFLHEEPAAIIFSGTLTSFKNTNTEKTGPPELLLRMSRDKAIALAHQILKEWE